MYFEMPFYMFSFSFASAIFFILYFSYLTIIKKSKQDIFNYRVVALSILMSIVIMLGIFFYIYMPLQGNSIVDNPFQKVSIRSVEANRGLFITVNYMNDGGSDANVTNIFVDGKPITSYATFVDIRDASGSSIKSLLNGSGYIIPMGKNGNFPTGQLTIVFTADAFASGQVINIGFHSAAMKYPNQTEFETTCKIP
jgi:hypothetical protein